MVAKYADPRPMLDGEGPQGGGLDIVASSQQVSTRVAGVDLRNAATLPYKAGSGRLNRPSVRWRLFKASG